MLNCTTLLLQYWKKGQIKALLSKYSEQPFVRCFPVYAANEKLVPNEFDGSYWG